MFRLACRLFKNPNETKAKLFEKRQTRRRFVSDESGDSEASSSDSFVALTNHYMEKIAAETFERFSRITLNVPPLDYFEGFRLNQQTLGEIAQISLNQKEEVLIHVNAAAHRKPVVEALSKQQPQWRLTVKPPRTILVSPPPPTPALRGLRAAQLRQVGRAAQNSISERRINLIKKARLEIRDISQEKVTISSISEISEKFKQAIESLENQKITELS